MDVLWATSNLPDPERGGGAGHEYELLRSAAAEHRIRLFAGGLEPGEEAPESLRRLDLVDVVGCRRPARPITNRVQLLARSLVGPAPYGFWTAGPTVAALDDAVAGAGTADLVQVFWPESAPVALAAAGRGTPTAFFASDCFVRHAERDVAAATTARQRLLHTLQRRRFVAWERAYRGAGTVVVASPVDAEALAGMGVRALVVPSALGDEWFEPASVERGEDLVVLVASLEYGPNVDAAEWLLADIWPRVAAALPAARLRLVGRGPSPELLAAAARAGAEVAADVPDVRPHLWEAAAAVVPIRLGSGMRNKVLHAVACGAPLVATETAVEGIGLVDGLHARLTPEDPVAVAAALVDTLSDRPAAASRAAAATSVAARYRTSRTAAAFAAAWAEATAR